MNFNVKVNLIAILHVVHQVGSILYAFFMLWARYGACYVCVCVCVCVCP